MLVKEVTDMSRRGFLGAMGAGAAAAMAPGLAQAKVSPIETTGLSMNSGPEHSVQRTAIQSGIKGVELAQFMAQVRHESADFSRMKEIGGHKYYAKRYDPKLAPKTAKILGNTKPGDGERYFGRGFIQITGRSNYQMAGDAIGIDLVKHPELAARPDIAAKIAVWYWKTRVKPNVSNFNDTSAVTKMINPAMRGLNDRIKHFLDYKSVMNVR
jgi:putative chitinase